MHPYEMASLIRERHKEESIKLRLGSLYTVIESLARDRLITARATQREGRRPERTVYALTAAGRARMRQWMREILSVPVKEYPQFEAGLCLLPALPPAEVLALLKERLKRLGQRIQAVRKGVDAVLNRGLHPLFLVEAEYHYAQLQSERAFVNKLVRRIVDEKWASVKLWREAHGACC